jgi:hypothetical protein
VEFNEDPTFSGLTLYHVRSVSYLFSWSLTEVADGAEEGSGVQRGQVSRRRLAALTIGESDL